MIRKISIMISVTVLSIITLVPVAGCISQYYEIEDPDNGYTQLSIKKGVLNFSFEYPASYQMPSIIIDEEGGETRVSTGRYDKEKEYYPEFIFITVNSEAFNAESWLNNYLEDESRYSENVSILSKGPVDICATTGVSAEYTYAYRVPDSDNVLKLVRIIAFDYDELNFIISFAADMSVAESVSDDYGHLLDTITIYKQ